MLRRMYELGARMMTLTWNHENELASPPTWCLAEAVPPPPPPPPPGAAGGTPPPHHPRTIQRLDDRRCQPNTDGHGLGGAAMASASFWRRWKRRASTP